MTKKRENPKKFNLETPIVAAYMNFLATPREMRPETEQTAVQFMENHKLKSDNSLRNYAAIDGFEEGVLKMRMKWRAYYLNRADSALIKRLEGMRITSTIYDRNGGMVTRQIQEVAPSQRAIELVNKIWGGYTESLKIINANPILDAAAQLDKEDKEKAGKRAKGKS